jgi:hypothetical protein
LPTDADRSSFFIGLVIVDIFVGLADAISLPYIVLFLVDKAALSPLSLGAILTARAVGSIAFSAAFGAWIDKKTTLKRWSSRSQARRSAMACSGSQPIFRLSSSSPLSRSRLAPRRFPNLSRSSSDASIGRARTRSIAP